MYERNCRGQQGQGTSQRQQRIAQHVKKLLESKVAEAEEKARHETDAVNRAHLNVQVARTPQQS